MCFMCLEKAVFLVCLITTFDTILHRQQIATSVAQLRNDMKSFFKAIADKYERKHNVTLPSGFVVSFKAHLLHYMKSSPQWCVPVMPHHTFAGTRQGENVFLHLLCSMLL